VGLCQRLMFGVYIRGAYDLGFYLEIRLAYVRGLVCVGFTSGGLCPGGYVLGFYLGDSDVVGWSPK